MRVGIAGTGFMGTTHAAGWAQTPAHLTGFVTASRASGESLARQSGARLFESFAEMLSAVDVVDICTPTDLHHEMVLAAAAAGKDIICEKPLARTLEQAQDMLVACRDAGVRLLVGHVVRYFPEYALARETVAAGEIGAPAVVRLQRGTFQPKKAEDNWFLEEARSGGMMLDLMIHDFDYARWVSGNVASVYAKRIRAGEPDAPVDHGLAILTHRSGTLTHVEGSWAYPPPLFRTMVEIAGANGWLRYDSSDTAALGVYLHRGDAEAPDVPLPGSPLLEDPYTTQIKSFYAHLADGAPVRVTAEDGFAALQIALAALESAETGRPVKLQPLAEVLP